MSKIEFITLMAVLVIIGVFIFINVKPLEQIQKGNDLKRKTDLKTLQEALETYYKDNGRYPKYSTKEPRYRIIRLDDSTVQWGQQWKPYLDVLPKDPSDSKTYVYYSDLTSGQAYHIYASLESSADKDLCPYNNVTRNNKCVNVPSDASCGGVCNYGVTSANVSP